MTFLLEAHRVSIPPMSGWWFFSGPLLTCLISSRWLVEVVEMVGQTVSFYCLLSLGFLRLKARPRDLKHYGLIMKSSTSYSLKTACVRFLHLRTTILRQTVSFLFCINCLLTYYFLSLFSYRIYGTPLLWLKCAYRRLQVRLLASQLRLD